jgi:hypothetical protein
MTTIVLGPISLPYAGCCSAPTEAKAKITAIAVQKTTETTDH